MTGGGVFYTADLHLGHRMLAGLRGFDDIIEHDDTLLRTWQCTVDYRDTVWILGDICAGGRGATEAALLLLDDMPGIKHLITGNHDAAHPMHRDAHKWQRRFLDVFASVQPFARRRIAGTTVLLSHFPYTTDRGGMEPRFPQYRLPDLGERLLHGHTHSSVQDTSARELHVGLDAWDLNLVHEGRVAEWITGGTP